MKVKVLIFGQSTEKYLEVRWQDSLQLNLNQFSKRKVYERHPKPMWQHYTDSVRRHKIIYYYLNFSLRLNIFKIKTWGKEKTRDMTILILYVMGKMYGAHRHMKRLEENKPKY